MGDGVPDHVREVGMEIPAERDVQHLHAPADGQRREARGESSADQLDLEAVALRGDRVILVVGDPAERTRIEVAPTREQEAVETHQQLVHRGLARGHQDRQALGRVQDVDVGAG
jgi:hypothetical protein